MSNCWVACGSESAVVRTWDFSKAEESARRAFTQKNLRRTRRRRQSHGRQRVWDLGNEESEEGIETAVQEVGDEAATLRRTSDTERKEGEPKLVNGRLHHTLPDSCRNEARRSYWHRRMKGSTGPSDTVDEGDLLEGLA